MKAKTDRRHTQGDESREKILDAATEIASQRGYHGTSIAAVSKLSGLPASSIYWSFASKDDLIAAVIRRSFDTWLQSHMLVNLRRPGADPAEHLVSSMRNQANALISNPEFLRLGLMLALERNPEEPSARAMFLQVREQSFAVLVDAFDRTLLELHGRKDPARARRIATVIMAAADGLFIAHQVDPTALDLEAEFELLANMVNAHLATVQAAD